MTELYETPIATRRYGQAGPDLVVLHGGPGAPGSLAPLARSLASSYRVLEPWQRVAEAAAPRTLDVNMHVADLAQVAPPRAHVLGHSWGAMLALSFAARHPDRVQGVVIVGCGTYDEATRRLFRERMNACLAARGAVSHVQTLRQRLATCVDSAERRTIQLELAENAADVMTVDALEPTWTEHFDPVGHEQTWNDVLRRQREGLEPRAFEAIRAPVLMLHGAEDPHPGDATRDLLKRFIPQLEYVSFPRCGHEPWRERLAREPFLQTVRDWLTSQPVRAC